MNMVERQERNRKRWAITLNNKKENIVKAKQEQQRMLEKEFLYEKSLKKKEKEKNEQNRWNFE